MGSTVSIRIGTGTYELREVTTSEVREARRAGGVTPGEREPLTWEEYLGLPADQRAKWGGPA